MRKVSTVILNPFITIHLVFIHGNLEAFFLSITETSVAEVNSTIVIENDNEHF